jgi:hypothetical protein
MMPKIAAGDANKVWIVPSEIGKALEGLGSTMTDLTGIPKEVSGPRKRVDMGSSERASLAGSGADAELSKANAAVQAAIAEARGAEVADAGAHAGPAPTEPPTEPPSEPPAV